MRPNDQYRPILCIECGKKKIWKYHILTEEINMNTVCDRCLSKKFGFDLYPPKPTSKNVKILRKEDNAESRIQD